jgi:hypothetical protein
MLTINGRVCSGDKFRILNLGWGPVKVAQAVLDRLGTELRFTYIPYRFVLARGSRSESHQESHWTRGYDVYIVANRRVSS